MIRIHRREGVRSLGRWRLEWLHRSQQVRACGLLGLYLYSYCGMEGNCVFSKRSQRAAGEKYIFYSPSQERVPYFSGQENHVPRNDAFAWLKTEGAKKKPQTNKTGKATKELWIFFTSSIKFYAVLCLPGGKFVQNRYFIEQLSLTALVFWELFLSRNERNAISSILLPREEWAE